MLKALLAPAVFVAMTFGASSSMATPTTSYSVTVKSCGANPQLTPGSSPFSGSIVPDPGVNACLLEYAPVSPFPTSIDGATGDHVAPECNVQISGLHVERVINVTAAQIRFEWDQGVSNPPPVALISWQCFYPWTPSATGSPGIGRKAQ